MKIISRDLNTQKKIEETIAPILEILDSAVGGSIELLDSLYHDRLDTAKTLLSDLSMVLTAIQTPFGEIKDEFQYAFIPEMTENIQDTILSISEAVEQNDMEKASYLTEYQLLPFFHILKESFYFWGFIYPDQNKMKSYYQNEFAQHYQNPYYQSDDACRYKLSIVVPGYNHVENTKKCVEHILKYTDLEALNAELILIDHGSSDETFAYFSSIPNAKVIRFKHNVRMYMFSFMPLICEGQYLVLVSNDVLVTKNWMENLLTCMDSDTNIASAVPMTPNICNVQIKGNYPNEPEAFVAWANEFNHSNSLLWSERARIMPPTCIYRMSALQKLGLSDPYFYSMEYWDDDFSFRARRQGYRQILCEDTACYHFGHVTSSAGYKKEGTLVYGRELFLYKNGVDAWGTGFCYDYTGLQILFEHFSPKQNCKILGINCGFGDTPVQIKNILRQRKSDAVIYNLTTENVYQSDLKPLSDYFTYTHSSPLSSAVNSAFPRETFDIIYLGEDIANYPDWKDFLKQIKTRLCPNGIVLFWSRNPWNMLLLNNMLQCKLPEERILLLDTNAVRSYVKELFSSAHTVSAIKTLNNSESFMKLYYRDCNPKLRKEIEKKLTAEKIYFVCR